MAGSIVRSERSVPARRDRSVNRVSENSDNQYQILLARLQSLGFGPGGMLRSAGITSTHRGEGVSTVACSLALHAAAIHDFKVLLIDANLGNPSLDRIFHLPRAPGFTEMFGADIDDLDCIHDLSSLPLESWPAALKHALGWKRRASSDGSNGQSSPTVSVLTSGNTSSGSNTLLNLESERILAHAADRFDLVIVDLPATKSKTCNRFATSNLDGVLFVLEADRTTDIAAQRGLHAIQNDGANVLGVVMNKYRSHVPKWIDRKLGD